MSKRAIRRQHIARLKKSRASYWGADKNNPLPKKTLGKLAATAKPCSCWQCASPRAVFGKPISQIRDEQDLEG